MKQGELSIIERTWLRVHHGDGAQCITLTIDEWGAGIKAQMGCLRYQGVFLKAMVLPQVFHDKYFIGPQDGMCAKRNLAIELWHPKPKLRLEPKSVRVH